MLSQGTFFCPHCGGDRQYAHKQARRWFTIFFLPVIPLKVLGEYVECQTCRNAYAPAVLSMPTTAGLQDELVTAYREAAVWLLRAGGTGRTAAMSVLSDAAGRQWGEDELDTDLRVLDVAPLFDRLVTLGASLTEGGKERFLTACTEIAAGVGVLGTGDRDLLDRIAAALTMSPAHARGVIDQTLENLSQH